MHQSLTIANTPIRQDEKGRFCLNDLHRAAGAEAKHQPSNFMRMDGTKDLIAEINQSSQVMSVYINVGGNNPGTFASRELVYAYAMWISAKFHLQVIRAYDSMTSQAAPAALSTMDILTLAIESEKGRLLALEQRDHAIATKAQIGSKREATAMATASAAKKEAAKLRDQLGFSARHATIMQVQAALGQEFNFVPLRRWCNAGSVVAQVVPDKRYPLGVKAWPAGAWMAVYGVDLVELFGEVTA